MDFSFDLCICIALLYIKDSTAISSSEQSSTGMTVARDLRKQFAAVPDYRPGGRPTETAPPYYLDENPFENTRSILQPVYIQMKPKNFRGSYNDIMSIRSHKEKTSSYKPYLKYEQSGDHYNIQFGLPLMRPLRSSVSPNAIFNPNTNKLHENEISQQRTTLKQKPPNNRYVEGHKATTYRIPSKETRVTTGHTRGRNESTTEERKPQRTKAKENSQRPANNLYDYEIDKSPKRFPEKQRDDWGGPQNIYTPKYAQMTPEVAVEETENFPTLSGEITQATETTKHYYQSTRNMFAVWGKGKDRDKTLNKLRAPRPRIEHHRPQKQNREPKTSKVAEKLNVGRVPAPKPKVPQHPTRFNKYALSGLSPHFSPYNFMKHFHNITKGFPKANFTTEILATTVSYNQIILVKITEKCRRHRQNFRANEEVHKYDEEPPEKKIIFIVHGLSVMGWDGLDCLTIVDDFKELLGYYLKNLNNFDIFLIPIANPDGLVALKSDKLWNKNLSPQDDCPGVALDRNFEVAWNISSNTSSCSQQYPGPFPFSEIETQAVHSIFQRYGHKMFAFFHVHSGTYSTDFFKGDAVLYPKGYTDLMSEDDKYLDMKGEIDEVMQKAGFQTLSVAVEPMHTWYGTVSGTSVDYASTVFGIPYSMELLMQIYSQEDNLQNVALTKVWKRVLKIIFTTITNKLKGIENT